MPTNFVTAELFFAAADIVMIRINPRIIKNIFFDFFVASSLKEMISDKKGIIIIAVNSFTL
jgi:hypothetical protein